MSRIQKNASFFIKTIMILFSVCIFSSAYAEFEPMLDESAMDLTADPCKNFEQYACGGWNARTTLPADKPKISRSFTSIAEENSKTNRELLENFAAGKNLEIATNAKKLGNFYSACMNAKGISNTTRTFLDHEFSIINTLTFDNFPRVVGKLLKKGISVFMAFDSMQDFKDSSQMIASLDQGGLGLPSRDYYFEDKNSALRAQYIAHISNMLKLSGLSQSQADSSAKVIMQFETTLAQKALRPVERRDNKNIYHIQTREELQKYTPHIDWKILFETLGSPFFATLNVAVPNFFSNLDELLIQTPLDTLKAYLRWHIISAYSTDLGGNFAQEHFNFFEKALEGQQAMQERWRYCIDKTDSSLGDALGEAFVAKTFGKQGKEKALNMVNAMQKFFAKNLDELDWMDSATRHYAVAKLNAIINKIGYPDKWRDLSKLTIGNHHIDNVITCKKFNKHFRLSKIGNPVDRSEWQMTPTTVNAYYNPSNNEIVFPAGILQSPFFSLTAPIAANYGAFGAVVGHEMTHGFDDNGRQYDLLGNLKDWWTPGIDKIFNAKAECLVNQYSQYTVADGVHLDGKLTLGENIADLGGLKMALSTLQASFPAEMTEEERIIEEKKFFTAFGQVQCTKSTPEYEKYSATTDEHSTPRFRINGVLTNMPEFAKTFSCETGTPLAPIKRCSIW